MEEHAPLSENDELDEFDSGMERFLDSIDLLFMRLRLVTKSRLIPLKPLQRYLAWLPDDRCQLGVKVFAQITPPVFDRPAHWALVAFRNVYSDEPRTLISYLLPVEPSPHLGPSLSVSAYTLTPLRTGTYEASDGALRAQKQDLVYFLLILHQLRHRNLPQRPADGSRTVTNRGELAVYLDSVTRETVIDHLKNCH
jgi:hypothetical protein